MWRAYGTSMSSPAARARLCIVPAAALLCLLPAVSAPLALVAGIAVALVAGNPWLAQTRRATHLLLAGAVVGLGAGMDLRVVAAVGLHGIGYTVAGIAGCLALGRALGAAAARRAARSATLITVGTAICGGSAIAAVVPVLRPKEHEVSVALAVVFLLNAVALLLFPAIGHRVGLSAAAFGLWSALAIHDTSSVVGAALSYGGGAVAVATTVKLARALWIVPVTLVLAARRRHDDGSRADGDRGRARAARPWFILGFVAAAALATFVPPLRPAAGIVVAVARRALVVTLFLIGANLTRDAFRAVGLRPLALGLTLWLTMATLTLAAILTHVVH